MISLDKKYRTRDGKEVRLYALDGGRSDKIHGAIRYNYRTESSWCIFAWENNGRANDNGDTHPLDLIEVVPEKWRVAYKTGEYDRWYVHQVVFSSESAANTFCQKQMFESWHIFKEE
jgi:hypothetical protein